jgi:hypothetical protein
VPKLLPPKTKPKSTLHDPAVVSGDLKLLTVKASKKKAMPGMVIEGSAGMEVISERTPKEVMIRHMNWFDQRADEIGEAIEKVLKTADPTKAEGLLEDLRDMLKYRELAVKCAQLVAPYVHPKLTAIAFAGGDKQGKFVLRAPPVLVQPHAAHGMRRDDGFNRNSPRAYSYEFEIRIRARS